MIQFLNMEQAQELFRKRYENDKGEKPESQFDDEATKPGPGDEE